jgi:hypothetical protein
MATRIQQFSQLRKALVADCDAVLVSQAGTDSVIEIPCATINRLFVEIFNAAAPANALDAFTIDAKPQGGTYQTLFSAFAAASGILIGVSTTPPNTLAAGGRTWLILDVTGLEMVRFSASSAGATGSSVTIRAQGGSY